MVAFDHLPDLRFENGVILYGSQTIVENGNKMGNNLPAPINHIFQQLSKFLSGENDDKRV